MNYQKGVSFPRENMAIVVEAKQHQLSYILPKRRNKNRYYKLTIQSGFRYHLCQTDVMISR